MKRTLPAKPIAKPKRKIKPRPVSRRNPYERALEQAEERLSKAVVEHGEHVARLTELTDEIPKLQEVIRGLQAYANKGTAPTVTAKVPEFVTGMQHAPSPQSNAGIRRVDDTQLAAEQAAIAKLMAGMPAPAPISPDVPAIPMDLARFFPPHPSAALPIQAQGRTEAQQLPEDERFLNDDSKGWHG